MIKKKKEYNKGRVILLFDDGTKSIELSKAVVYEEGIKIGSSLTEDELYSLTLLSEQKRAYHRALYYISKSNMSSGYLRKKLDKKFYIWYNKRIKKRLGVVRWKKVKLI